MSGGADGGRRPGPGWAGALADLVVPLECAGCGRAHERWCADCAGTLLGAPLRVRTRADLRVPAWALARHTGAPARAVSAYKDRGRPDLARPIGAALACPGRRVVCFSGDGSLQMNIQELATAVEQQLDRRVPPRFRRDAHHWLILHGRYVCTARAPKCGECTVRAWCDTGRKLPAA